MWFLVGNRPIRFSLNEFEEITTLNCRLPDEEDRSLASGDLWTEMGLIHGDGPTFADLKRVLKGCRQWNFEKRKMVGLLMILYVGIYGMHPNSRLPVFAGKLVMDPVRFERYPWGRVAFEQLITSLRAAQLTNASYTIHGLVHAALIWAYESIPGLGELCGGRREGDIPLLRWSSSNKRGLGIEDIIDYDMDNTEDHKVMSYLVDSDVRIYNSVVDFNCV